VGNLRGLGPQDGPGRQRTADVQGLQVIGHIVRSRNRAQANRYINNEATATISPAADARRWLLYRASELPAAEPKPAGPHDVNALRRGWRDSLPADLPRAKERRPLTPQRFSAGLQRLLCRMSWSIRCLQRGFFVPRSNTVGARRILPLDDVVVALAHLQTGIKHKRLGAARRE